MAKNFDDFTEDASINPGANSGDYPYWIGNGDYLVGFANTGAGGERKWPFSALKEDLTYAFPVLHGVNMTVLINGATGAKISPANPAYLTSLSFTVVSSTGSAGTYTLTFGVGVLNLGATPSAEYSFFAQAYKASLAAPIHCYATTKTATSLTIKCVDSAGAAVTPDRLSVHIVLQP